MKKVNKNQYHEKCNHYYQNKMWPTMARLKAKTIRYSHSKTLLLDYHDTDSAANVTDSSVLF